MSDLNPELDFKPYLVAYIDILGQKDIIKQITGIPENQEEQDRFINLAKETIGFVDRFRSGFKDYFNAYVTGDPQKPRREMPEELKDLTKSEIKFITFSDCIVIYIPMQFLNNDPISINGLYGVLAACSSMYLLSLCEKHSIRGGIDVGIGVETYPGEIFGPAFISSYELESKVAQYPRIVIGDGLIKYLSSMINLPGNDIKTAYIKKTANHCKEMIKMDFDGHAFLDCLGEEYRKTISSELIKVIPLNDAKAYIYDQYKFWQGKKDSKLAFRYLLLLNYFERRMKDWPTPNTEGESS